MKDFCVIHILLFVLLMLVHQCASAQDYLLTTRGDSVAGEVKPLVYGPEKKVQIISDGKKTTYSLFEIRAYSQAGETFHPMKGETGYVFMKLLKSGYLSLYAFQQDNQVMYDGLFLVKLDGDRMVVPNLGFKKYVTKFLSDCSKVSDRIKEGELGKKDLTTIVDDYNECIKSRTIDHKKNIDQQQEQTTRISAWDSLEEKIKENDFKEKTDALEMIEDIKEKIKRGEKIPNFLLEGLKNSLKETSLTTELDQAISEIAN